MGNKENEIQSIETTATEQPCVDTKKWYESMTVWFSGLIFFLPDIAEFLQGLIGDHIIDNPEIVYWVVKAIAIINLYLRIQKTKTAIK